jgi:hypothetical protein
VKLGLRRQAPRREICRLRSSWCNGDFATVIVKYAAKTVTLIDLPFSQT